MCLLSRCLDKLQKFNVLNVFSYVSSLGPQLSLLLSCSRLFAGRHWGSAGVRPDTPAAAWVRVEGTVVFLLLGTILAVLVIFPVGHRKLIPNLLPIVALKCLVALLQLGFLPIEYTRDGLLLSYTGSYIICIFQG